MDQLRTDTERALQSIRRLEQEVADQRARIDYLRQTGASTFLAEDLLVTLETARDLFERHIERIESLRDTQSLRYYRYFVLEGDGPIAATESISARDDSGAMVVATELLASKYNGYPAIEVWFGKKLIGRIP